MTAQPSPRTPFWAILVGGLIAFALAGFVISQLSAIVSQAERPPMVGSFPELIEPQPK